MTTAFTPSDLVRYLNTLKSLASRVAGCYAPMQT